MEAKLEALATAHSYIQTLYDNIKEVIEDTRVKSDRDNSEKLVQIFDGLEWVLEVIVLTQDIQLQKINVDNIKNILHEIIDALQNADFLIIADLLEYEILEKLEEWYEQIGQTMDILKKTRF